MSQPDARPRGGGLAASDRALPPCPDGDGLFVVANRSSGTAVVRADPLRTLHERLPRAVVHELDDEDAATVLRRALAGDAPPRILGIVGGDGTVASAAAVAVEHGLPLLVVPGGTFNHFARALGVTDAAVAVDALVAGTGSAVDVAELRVGRLGPFTVLNAASVGIYPDFVARRDRLRPRLGKWLGGVVGAAAAVRRVAPVGISIRGRRARVWSLVVSVGRDDPLVPAPLQRHGTDDGVLDVRILHAGSRSRAVAALAFGRRTAAVLRGLGLLPERSEAWTTTDLDVVVRPAAGRTAAFAHDGEPMQVRPDDPVATGTGQPTTGVPVQVRLLPGALDVYRPGEGETDAAAN
ncbi:diacylglycerol/lipid kinase family protein [Agromyces sp. MMS24-JH15]|uniref:diacylglycerol/lipid kinase family protein n=1 Tax=Agromyces sp. MMS24-JH15 TaxID=3243765 RepID=UPI003749E83B